MFMNSKKIQVILDYEKYMHHAGFDDESNKQNGPTSMDVIQMTALLEYCILIFVFCTSTSYSNLEQKMHIKLLHFRE